ncbi:hypothetical protein AVEN_176080-1 [Araneus ventricosus]|uniref:Gustatory receptor n=1 Tax=Araneus ventricosus TaxID=182803 RepID=A0A4Y2WVW0_ARAVE|nr:hypothetical protein AVEN_176080-1 [Araneus ventricosus]
MFVTILMISRRKKIYKAVQSSCHLSTQQNTSSRKGSARILVLAICVSIPIATVVVSLILHFYYSHEIRMATQDFLGSTESYNLQSLHIYSYSICFVYIYSHNLLTMMFLLLLSYETFTNLGDGVQKYRKSLRKIISNGCVDVNCIQEYSTSFRRIVDCVNTVEVGFSWNTLFLVISNISTFFLMLSAIADGRANYLKVLVLITIVGTFFASILEFIAIMNCAMKLCEENRALKRLALCLSEKTFSTNNAAAEDEISFRKSYFFFSLADALRGATLELTGGQMFALRESFIMSVVGCMLTYGVLIFQFSHR